MMSRRIVIGTRSNGDTGVFVAPGGLDAYTAEDSSLVLSIHEKVSSLLLMGYVSSSGSVLLGFGAKPIIILTSIRTVMSSYTGIVRPSPLYYAMYTTPSSSHASASVASDGSSMYVTAPVLTRYEVYNEAA